MSSCLPQNITFLHSLGQTETSAHPSARSALPPSTDIVSSARHVRQVPNIDIRGDIVSRSFADPPLWPDPHTATKTWLIVNFRTDRSIRFILIGCQSNVLIRLELMNGSFCYCRCSARQVCRTV